MPELSQGARSALTLSVLCLMLVVGALWGWSAVTKPLPGKADAPVCVDEALSAGDKVFPSQVVVSVLNAGRREGLAGRTMDLLERQGFAPGESDNAPDGTRVALAQIWTEAPGSAAVRLVASRFDRVEVVERDAPAAGVVVVVGDEFTDLVKGRRAAKARGDEQVCSPPVG